MNPAERLEKEFWSSLKSDMTVMLGLPDVESGRTRPMTAQIEGDHGPIWFFTSNDTEIVRSLANPEVAIMTYASKGHALFASVEGRLQIDNNRTVIDRLWNAFVAAWYEEGKADPKLTLLRFDPAQAEIWENENNLLAGVKMLLGLDPKKEYADKVATVSLKSRAAEA
jgi:general stress protein 26